MALKRSPALGKVLRLWASRELFHIEKGGHLSNHMSHGLIALGNLGASEERLNQYGEAYKETRVLGHKIGPALLEEREEILTREDLLQLKGKFKNFLGIADYFKRELERTQVSPQELVSDYLPEVLAGLSGRIFHPLITLGYALHTDDRELIIDGLSYMYYACRTAGSHLSLDLDALMQDSNPDIEPLTASGLFHLIAQVKEEKKFDGITPQYEGIPPYQGWAKGFQLRLAILGDKAGETLDEYVLPILKSAKTLEDFVKDREHGTNEYKTLMTEVFDGITWFYNDLSEYNKDSSFIILHAVTSCWSLAHVLPYLTSQQRLEAIVYYVRAIVAGWASMKDDKEFEVGPIPWERDFTSQFPSIPEFSAPVGHILSTNESDEHKIKVVFTCLDRMTSTTFTPLKSEKHANFLKVVAARQFEILPWELP